MLKTSKLSEGGEIGVVKGLKSWLLTLWVLWTACKWRIAKFHLRPFCIDLVHQRRALLSYSISIWPTRLWTFANQQSGGLPRVGLSYSAWICLSDSPCWESLLNLLEAAPGASLKCLDSSRVLSRHLRTCALTSFHGQCELHWVSACGIVWQGVLRSPFGLVGARTSWAIRRPPLAPLKVLSLSKEEIYKGSAKESLCCLWTCHWHCVGQYNLLWCT